MIIKWVIQLNQEGKNMLQVMDFYLFAEYINKNITSNIDLWNSDLENGDLIKPKNMLQNKQLNK